MNRKDAGESNEQHSAERVYDAGDFQIIHQITKTGCLMMQEIESLCCCMLMENSDSGMKSFIL